MGLLELIIVLVLVGVLLYFVNQLIPMDPNIKTLLNVVVLIVLVLWVLRALGLFSSVHDIRIGLLIYPLLA